MEYTGGGFRAPSPETRAGLSARAARNTNERAEFHRFFKTREKFSRK